MGLPCPWRRHATNPYPDEFTLLFWYSIYRSKAEEHDADWREQSAYIREAGLESFRNTPESLRHPWLALKAAYEAKCAELAEMEHMMYTEAGNW